MKINIKSKAITGLVLILCLVLGVAVGYALGRIIKTKEINAENNEKMHMDHSAMEMKHEHIEVAKGRLNPIVKLVATKDTMGGYNLNIQTNNFFFTPEKAGADAVQNTGHAHLFINGEKIGRVYGPWIYLGNEKFKNGTNTIEVSLNANDHSSWINNKTKEEISTTTEVFVSK